MIFRAQVECVFKLNVEGSSQNKGKLYFQDRGFDGLTQPPDPHYSINRRRIDIQLSDSYMHAKGNGILSTSYAV
jgi:hypothetical protein